MTHNWNCAGKVSRLKNLLFCVKFWCCGARDHLPLFLPAVIVSALVNYRDTVFSLYRNFLIICIKVVTDHSVLLFYLVNFFSERILDLIM